MDLEQLHWCEKCACNMSRAEVMDEQCCVYFECPLEQKFKMPPVCDGCGKGYADQPSKLCPGCQAYRDHQH